MDLDQHGDSMGGAGVVWTNAMSTFVLTYLTNLVASGTRTSTGFKQAHLNSCAKDLNEHMKVHVSGIQVSNHLRKWRKIWAKINKLKNLSGALWDEGTCTIRLEHEHYTGHVKDHPKDATFLNTPLEHYHEMATIFGNSMATGQYAKGANDPLATNVIELEEDAPVNEHVSVEEVTASGYGGGDSSASKPSKKRAKTSSDDELLAFMTTGIDRLAQAIEKTASSDTDVPDDLWDNMMDLPGFDEAQLAHYYAYLCENVALARAFNKLSISNKLVWVTRYITRENL